MGSVRKMMRGLNFSVKKRNEWWFLEKPSIFQVKTFILVSDTVISGTLASSSSSTCRFDSSSSSSLKISYQ